MQELIKITEHNGSNVVSARELHKFLAVSERFSAWFERQIQYGFTENEDYVGCKQFNTLANQELIDYALTLDCAKEISMLQRSEKGKEARRYFLDCEKILKQKLLPSYQIENPVERAKKWIQEQEKVLLLEKQIKHNEVKINFINRVIASEDMIDIGQCAKVLELPFGRNTLFKELREKGIFFKNKNEPKQAFIERGYFKLKETFITTNTHGTISVIKVLVTQRGLGYISTLFESAPSPKTLKKIT